MKPRLILIALFALSTLSPIPLRFWSLPAESLTRISSDFSKLQVIDPNPLSSFDFGSDNDCLEYAKNSISIFDCQDSSIINWQSPETWKVTEAISADLNRDGKNEMVMVVWRPHKVWPIDTFLPSGGRIADFHDETGLSCHLILVGWDGTKYRELWAGSSLVEPVFNIRAADLDGDGNQELVTIEGMYDNWNKSGDLTVWEWSGFGFRLRERLQEKFSEFGIVSTNQSVMIITD
ncbi:MAG TPA: hypothetical protein DIW44_04830 [Anaerolineaceae bacterium]|nr:hypothetical protein [Anaerolineaceae bacterium]